MEILLGLLGGLVAIASINHFYEQRKERKEKMEKEKINNEEEEHEKIESQDLRSGNSTNDSEEPHTLELMFTTLCNIGCQPNKNDDGTILVSYQGEKFLMEFVEMYVMIWDLSWNAFKADDPEMPTIREAVNITNFRIGPTVVLSAPNDEGIIYMHSRRDIMLHPDCPDNEIFVQAVLNSFFVTKEQQRYDFQQLKDEQTETQKSHRPTGFSLNDQNYN